MNGDEQAESGPVWDSPSRPATERFRRHMTFSGEKKVNLESFFVV